MPAITYEGWRYELATGESVLDALLRNGVDAAHSCRAGTCGSCLLRAGAGEVPALAQSGLKETWKSQGYFLACVCWPENDLELVRVGADAQMGGSIVALEPLSQTVRLVRIRSDETFHFRAGQFVALGRNNGVTRSYSIASLPETSNEIDLHVRRVEGGRMSGWLHDEAKPGDRVSILGPSGDCFYVSGNQDQPLVLAGTGTGLAPLYGIVRDALRHGHRGPIHLFHGALNQAGLYLKDELRALEHEHSHFHYTPAVLDENGPLNQVLSAQLPKLAGWRAYVCGDPAIVQKMRKLLFLAGVSSREIHADAFLPSA